jgi:GGDEF domain-containing protein
MTEMQQRRLAAGALTRGREELIADLEQALQAASPPQTFAIFVVGGLDAFRELYGRFEAEAVVELVGARLSEQLDERARLYEPRRGEFAVLVPAPAAEVEGALEAAADELSNRFAAFDLNAACGVVFLPDEATASSEAIALADERLAERALVRHARDRRSAPRP